MTPRLILIGSLFLVGLSACGTNVEPAATVNGTEISRDKVTDELDDITYVAANSAPGSALAGLASIGADENGNYPKEGVQFVLGNRITSMVFEDMLAERGDAVTEEDRQESLDNLALQIPELDQLDERSRSWVVGRLAEYGAVQEALLDALAAEQGLPISVEEYFEANRDAFVEVCVRHILVADRGQAAEVVERIEAGEDFGALAQELSQDPGSAAQGGQLPCSPANAYVPEFAAAASGAELGELVLVETQFGAHVLIVDERLEADLTGAVEQQVRQQYQQELIQAVGPVIDEAIIAADVSLAPANGEWVDGQIVG